MLLPDIGFKKLHGSRASLVRDVSGLYLTSYSHASIAGRVVDGGGRMRTRAGEVEEDDNSKKPS